MAAFSVTGRSTSDSELSVKTSAASTPQSPDSEPKSVFPAKEEIRERSSPTSSAVGPGLLDAIDLLAEIWPRTNSRPSLRWLRKQTALRTLPYIKIGHKVYFNPTKVRQALEKKFTVECR